MGLKDAYQPFFKIGAAISEGALADSFALQNVTEEYNSITCENDMKPENLLDEEENCSDPAKYNTNPAVRFEKAAKYLAFAKEHGIGMRGHTLVWHHQTPEWFFMRDYSTRKDAELADRDTMLARMESYIRSVLEYVQTIWPGVIYAWDVVNEAIDNEEMRDSLWTKTIGEDFVLHAFRFARKYADEGVALFYNDYDTFLPGKRNAICKKILQPLLQEKLVDGMGMQTHLTMETALEDYGDSLCCFGALPLQIQITEMDIHNADPSEYSMKMLAKRYGELFTLFLKVKRDNKANITGVTFWGLSDEMSWLSGFRGEKSYPLLFDGQLNPKEAYRMVKRCIDDKLQTETI